MIRGKVGAEVSLADARHARSAAGMAELPMGISVEIELVARVQ